MINTSGDLVSLLIDLIAVESVTDNEEELCNSLFETLSLFKGELVREGNSLVLHQDYKKKSRIALIGHIDTVPVGGSTTEAYFNDDTLWGRGACDMKSGLASMLKILDEIQKGKILPQHNLSFVFYENEEGAIPNGINTLLEKGHLDQIDFAYILEPTEGRYSVGCLGSLTITKEITGVSAHSANPKTGVNALEEAFLIYDKIRLMDREIGSVQKIDGLEFYETVNATSLNTFNAFNVLPPRAEMIINYRFSPSRSIKEAKDLLFSHIGAEGISILDEVGSCYIGSDHQSYLHEGIESEIMQAWTDIAQLNEAGIPAINFGPGSIKFAHKPDERISIADFKGFYRTLVKHL
jgi:succinyl-diaminopimelate desuccinylase